MHKAVVVMFCGPHDEEEIDAPTRRIDRAIQVALELELPLLIAGDANSGKDIRFFGERAREAAVELVIDDLYDERANTLADAELVATKLGNDRDLALVSKVYLVTDDWHMDRASLFLHRTLSGRFRRTIVVTATPVTCGPTPPLEEIEREKQGIRDFLSGTYGQRKVPAFGKPTCIDVSVGGPTPQDSHAGT